MSFADYLRLRDYLDRPGETVLDGRVTVTHAFNVDDDRADLKRRANEVAVVLGLHDRCGACGGEDGVPLDEVGTGGTFICYYCNGTGIRSAGSFTSAIDRLAIPLVLESLGVDGHHVTSPHYTLPTSPCETCAVVQCSVCRRRKKPYGRDASMQSSLCDSDCSGYHQEPYAGTHWDSDDCPDCDGMGRKPDHEWKRPRSFAQGEPCPCPRDYKRRTHKGRRQRTRHAVASPKCPWCSHGVIAHGPGVRGWRAEGAAETQYDYPCGNNPDADDDAAWAVMADALLRYHTRYCALAGQITVSVHALEDVEAAREAIRRAVEPTITLANETLERTAREIDDND